MSIIGTGIAAGVANTANAARQQAAAGSSRDAQRADSAQQTDKFTLTQLHDASATRDADEDMPDQQAPGYENLYRRPAQPQAEDEESFNDAIHDADAPAASTTDIPLAASYGPTQLPLFHALNLKA